MSFPAELYKLLEDKIGLNKDLAEDYFKFSEDDSEWVLTARKYVETSTYNAMIDLVKQTGGAFQPPKPPYKDNPAVFQIPKLMERKAEEPQVGKVVPNNKIHPGEPQPATTITVKPNQLIYDRFSPRKATKKRVQRMGEAIDSEGVEAVPKPKATWNFGLKGVKPSPSEQSYWLFDGQATARALEQRFPQFKVDFYDITEEEADFLAMRLNQVHGDPVEPIDEARHLKKLMEKYGYNQKQLSEKFKRSEAWISNRMALLKLGTQEFTRVNLSHAREIATAPEEVRPEIVDKVEREGLSRRETAKVVGAIKEAPVKASAIIKAAGVPTPYHCGFPGCKRTTYYPTRLEGVIVCPHHRDEIKKNPSLIEKLKEKSSPPPKVKEKEWEPTVPKPTWPERKAMMHPKVSKMEEAISLALTEKGVAFEQQREFCVRSTKPDFYFPHQNLAVYLDGEEAHKKRVDRDNFLRELLTKRYGIRVLGLTYRDNTQKSRDEILQKVLDEVNTQGMSEKKAGENGSRGRRVMFRGGESK